MPESRAALADLNGHWIDRFHGRNGLKCIVLDMDSSVSPTHGDQEGATWNGHFDCTCYHPNFLFNQFGMLERCALRNGDVHSADGWRNILDPVIARYAGRNLGGAASSGRTLPMPSRHSMRDWKKRIASTSSVCPSTMSCARRSRIS